MINSWFREDYMQGQSLFPWMTRREVAEYLRCGVDEVDARLVPLSGHPSAVPGKMRYLLMDAGGATRVSILAADVLSLHSPIPAMFERAGAERRTASLRP